MKTRLIAVACLLVAGCGDPDSKLNSEPNNTANNASNVTPNNTANNGGGGNIVPGNYNQTCQVETDCMLILSGDPCGCGPCKDAAINISDQTKYQDDKAAGMCEEISCPAIGCGEEQLPHCNSGMCEVRVAKYTVGDDWDRSCSTAADCVGVFEGEVCEACQCANTAINIGDLEDYNAQFDVECSHNVACDCAAPLIECNEGLCVIQ
jgi:hypothetical protein